MDYLENIEMLLVGITMEIKFGFLCYICIIVMVFRLQQLQCTCCINIIEVHMCFSKCNGVWCAFNILYIYTLRYCYIHLIITNIYVITCYLENI